MARSYSRRAVRHSVPPPIAMVTCYPANPTAQTADLDFYKDAVAFAKKHDIFILSDLAYAEVYFDEKNPPPSVLQVPGAMDVAVEFTSMSKTFSMAGWRMAWVCGNADVVGSLLLTFKPVLGQPPLVDVLGVPTGDCCGGAFTYGASYLGPEHGGVRLAGVVGIDALKLEPLPSVLTGTPSVPPPASTRAPPRAAWPRPPAPTPRSRT